MSNLDVSTTIQGFQPLDQVLNTDEYQKALDEQNLAATNIEALKNSILKLEEIIGIPLNRLTTTQKTSIIDAMNSILTENDFSAMIGNPELLTTTEKSNLVGAINELDFTKIDVAEFSAFVLSLLDLGSQSAFRDAIGAAAAAHTHNANDINAGILNIARIPELPASKTTSGVFDIERIPQNPNNKEFAVGDLATLTSGQLAAITTSTRIITSDGRAWRWDGVGNKNTEASYVSEAAELLGQAIRIPSGPTSDRPAGLPSSIKVFRYNTTLLSWEGWNGTVWGKIGGGAATGITPPTPAQDGDLWWSSELGILFIYFVDADATGQWIGTNSGSDPAALLFKANNLSDLANVADALTNLGFSAYMAALRTATDAAAARTNLGLIWKPLTLIKPTVNVAQVDFAIPASAKHLRISGALAADAAAAFGFRLSYDNGVTFIASSSYVVGYIYQAGNVVSGQGTSSISVASFALSDNSGVLRKIPFNLEISLGEGAQYTQYISKSGGYASGTTQAIYGGYLQGYPGVPTNLRIMPTSAGNVSTLTSIAVEYI